MYINCTIINLVETVHEEYFIYHLQKLGFNSHANYVKMLLIIHQMQIWRTTRSSPRTSRMEARLSRLSCFVLTGKSCFVVYLVYFVSPSIKVFGVRKCYQNRAKFSTVERMLFLFPSSPLRERQMKERSS